LLSFQLFCSSAEGSGREHTEYSRYLLNDRQRLEADMTDLGFGIADRRSVLAVLFTLLLSQVIFGNPIPIDTTSVFGLFASLVTMTGFIYISRVLCRTVMAVTYALFRFPFDISATVKEAPFRWDSEQPEGVKRLFAILKGAISASILRGIIYPLIYETSWRWYYSRYRGLHLSKLDLGILGVVDRLVLIGIAFASTMPQLSTWRVPVGVVGVLSLLVIYVATGRFTFVLMDALHKTEEDQERLIRAAATQPTFPSVIRTKPDYGDR
jgi:hypothetical protein